jgi:hypothetical protein
MKTEGQQLEMFLTVEQEQTIERYLNNHDFHFRNQKGDAEKKSQFLLENGFIEGVHFENTFTFEENVTETVSLGGRWYDVEEFETELNVTKYQGGVFLLHDAVGEVDGERQIVKKSTWFSLTSEGKIECSSIVGSYRSVKPATLLRKLVELNAATKDNLKFANQKDKHYNNAIEQLKLEFPNASSITKGNEWVRTYNLRNSYNVDVITVAFEDGSYIQYDVNNYNGEIKIRKVFDKVVESLTSQDKVNNLKNRLAKV